MTSNAEAVASAERAESRAGVKPLPPGAAVRPRDPSFVLRVVSAVVFLPLLVLMARVGGLLFLGFTLLFIGVALREFYVMMEGKGLSPHWKSGFLSALLFPVGIYTRLRAQRTEEWHLAGLL